MNYIVKKADKINGEVKISGSKNAALPIIVSTLLFKEKVTLYNVPYISDVINMIEILKDIGCIINYENETLNIDSTKIKKKINSKYISKLRASYYLMGALSTRMKCFDIDYPGGCKFTLRPIDIHISSFRKLGIIIEESEKIKFSNINIKDTIITLPKISVGVTINIILATTISNAKVIINNASIEPEVIDLIQFLNKAGANIKHKKRKIEINGVEKLNPISYTVMPDRIEAASFLLLASCIPNSSLLIKNVRYDDLKEVVVTLEEMKNKITLINDSIKIDSPNKIKGIEKTIAEYPSFPTDLQPILCTTLLSASSPSIITDSIYPDRISHIEELNKLGGNIYFNNGKIYIYPSKLNSGKVYAKDLRCGFAMIIAGILSSEYVEIEDFNYILRGYSSILDKLKSINIRIIAQ